MASEHTITHFSLLPQHSYNSPNLPGLLPNSSQGSLGPTVLLSLLFRVKYGLNKQNLQHKPVKAVKTCTLHSNIFNITWCRAGAKTRSKPCMDLWDFLPLAVLCCNTFGPGFLMDCLPLCQHISFILSVRICSSRCFVGNTVGRSGRLPLPVARKISFNLANWSSVQEKKERRLMTIGIVFILVLGALRIYIEGSRPEWCISSMIYSGDTPFWSETLDMQTLDN